MSDLGKRILDILGSTLNDALKTRKNMQSMVYRDEPIIRRASDLKRPEPRKPEPVSVPSVPPVFEQMRRMASSTDALYMPREEVFFHQARFMEHYEDTQPYNGLSMHYLPTYQSLTNAQLRGYFTWRTRYRRGQEVIGCPDYYKLHTFELLHLIGAENAEDGYEKLTSILHLLIKADPLSQEDAAHWLRDFVLYYHLDTALLADPEQEAFDHALSVVLRKQDHDDVTFLHALLSLSSYSLDRSPFYKQYPELTARVVSRLFDALSAYYEKHRKNSLSESLFGRQAASSYVLFRNAIFYDHTTHPDYSYQVSPYMTYQCRGRWWTVTRYQGKPHGSKELGHLLKSCDRILRDQYSFDAKLRDDGRTPKYVETLLVRIIQDDQKEQAAAEAEAKAREAAKLTFDLSGLAAIRASSARTMDRLIVEEETEPEAVPAAPVVLVQEPAVGPLSSTEQAFLRALLEGRSYEDLLASEGLILSVLVDHINEALYDLLADTAIEWDGDRPVPVEDYIDDLKGLIQS
ncbi:MAG: TerB N-terminal domain-containing protein [Clostridiales bacterium]|nr:TerB N-terminal domain-containing protein [Clostridiales bacterium]